MDPSTREIKLAELHFLRAFYYFELIKVFGPKLPWIDETNMLHDTPVPNDLPVWGQVENDFQNAIDGLPDVSDWVGDVNVWAAKAFYAKLLLYEKKYEEAIALFNDVINSGKTTSGEEYALLPYFENNFNIQYNNSSESVFAQQAKLDGSRANPGYMLAYPYGSGAPGGCCGFFQPSQSLVNSFKVDENGLPLFDPLHETFPFNSEDLKNDDGILSGESFTPDSVTALDPRLDWTVGRRGIPYLDWGINPGSDWIRDQNFGGPYVPIKNVYRQADELSGHAGLNFGWAPGSELNYNLMRFADVLLMAAECAVELNDLPTALSYVNMIRSRAGVSHVKNGEQDAANYQVAPYPSFPDQQYAREVVRFERKLELAMEGHRFFDLARWGGDYAEKELNLGYLGHESFHRTQFSGAVFDTCQLYFTIPQLVTLYLPTTKNIADSAISLHATSPSGLPVSFSVSDTSVVKITGDKLYIAGLGTATVTAYQSINPACMWASTNEKVITITAYPVTQASHINFYYVQPGQVSLSWLAGSGSARIVFMKKGDTGSAHPSDSMTYIANSQFGLGSQIDTSGWYCVYNGTADSDTITGLEPSTLYRAMVIDYDGNAGNEKYLLSTAVNNPVNQATKPGVEGFIDTFTFSRAYATNFSYSREIIADGTTPMISHGMCWAKHPVPTLADSAHTDGTYPGVFSTITGHLKPNTTYYARTFVLYPSDTIYGDVVTFTTISVNASMNSAYDLLIPEWVRYWFGADPNNWIYGSIAGGDANKGSDPGDQPAIIPLQAYQSDTMNLYNLYKWNAMYEGIARCNDAITAVIDSFSLDLVAAEPMLAELRFLRAFYYFELIKVFGPRLPWIDETNMLHDTPVPNDFPIWTQVGNDFLEAIDGLPDVSASPGQPNISAARAFYGKLLLYQKKYIEAKVQFDAVINSGKTTSGESYALLPHFEDNFNIQYNNSTESVFAQQAKLDGVRANPGYMLAYPYGSGPGGCCGFFQPSQSLVNSYKVDENGLPLFDPLHETFPFNDTDLSNDEGIESWDFFMPDTVTPIDPRLDWTIGRRGIPYLDWGIHPGKDWIRDQQYGGPYSPIKNVYRAADVQAGRTGTVGGWAPGSELNFNLMRYADVLLMAAECAVELNDLNKALVYVNMIRSRAGVSHVKNGTQDAANYQIGLYIFPNQQYAREAVRFERKLELAMEGHRFFDLVRWGSDYAVKELNSGYLDHESTLREQFAGALFDTCALYFPIPQSVTLYLPQTRDFSDPPFMLHATSPSGLPVHFSVNDTTVVKIQGDMLYITGPGMATVTAYQSVKPGCLPASIDEKVILITDTTVAKLTAGYILNDVSTPGGHDGWIDLSVSGGTPPYFYSWNTGAFTQDINFLYEGTYTVTINDSKSRSLAVSVEIKGPQVQTCDITVDFTYTIDTLTQEVSLNVSTSEYEYFWSFGDGTVSAVPSPTHNYSHPGRYKVCLNAYDDISDCSYQVCKMIEVGLPECIADYTYYVDPSDSLLVHFSDNTKGAVTSWYWNFADGNISTEQDVDHKFQEAGTYPVCLYTLDETTGCLSEACRDINIGSVPLVADFSCFINPVTLKVTFTNNSLGNIMDYYWTYGDGSVYTGKDSSHIYKNPGVYTVCLSVRNKNTGRFTGKCKVLKVGTLPCNLNAAFNYFVDPVTMTVNFTDLSTGTVHLYSWNFGDGTSSTQVNPIHQFTRAGYYLVSLSVRDTLTNCTDFHAQLIQVGQVKCKALFSYSVDPDSLTVTLGDNSLGHIKDYFWTFGDGYTSTSKDPAHEYSNPGLYQVSLTITDSSGTCMDNLSAQVQIGYVDCSADFTVFVDSLTNIAYFTCQSLGSNIRYYWIFSDGTISTEKDPVHQFAFPGYQKVSLSTFNELSGCMDYKGKVILIGSQGIDCEADFIYQTDEATHTVSFADRSLGDDLTWFWNFGDTYTSLLSNPSHQYSSGGIYNVCLTVYSASNVQNTTCKYVFAGVPAAGNCLAQFIYTVDNDALQVNYIDKSFGEPDHWFWEFGDRNTSYLRNPANVFAEPGYYVTRQQIMKESTGCISDAFALVNVKMEGRLMAGFGYTIDSTELKAESYPVDYVGVSLGDASKYKWSFGDGTYDSTTTTPTHIYSSAGTYEVCLTVYDDVSGEQSTSCNSVVVGSPSFISYPFKDKVLTLQCYPNPSDDICYLVFNIPESGYTELTIYSIAGSKLRSLVNRPLDHGRHVYEMNSSDWDNGMYLVRLQTVSGMIVQKFIIQH